MQEIHFNDYPTPIEYYGKVQENDIYIKRDDLTEPTLGGNKVRKLELFLEEAQDEHADYIVTYGAAQSNHCRLTVSMANKLGFKTLLILAKTDEIHYNGNFLIYDLYDTEIVWTETNEVPETIEKTLNNLKQKGYNPYFIQGGGHGDLGTHAYKLAFEEILYQEEKIHTSFSHIFHASGTGTTQAGLIAGNTIHQSAKHIEGISVARNKERGTEVIKGSVQSYLESYAPDSVHKSNDLNFNTDYIGNGYAHIYPEIIETIKNVIKTSSIMLDPVYTGKAFYGMLDYIKKNNVKGQQILFIHTGGIPLLFNYASKFEKGVTE